MPFINSSINKVTKFIRASSSISLEISLIKPKVFDLTLLIFSSSYSSLIYKLALSFHKTIELCGNNKYPFIHNKKVNKAGLKASITEFLFNRSTVKSINSIINPSIPFISSSSSLSYPCS